MSFLDKVWYQKLDLKNGLVIVPLLPLSALFYLISTLRRKLYQSKVLKVNKLKVPSIVVGGISVGGSGKTPMCIALIDALHKQGYKVGLISRGYKGVSDSYPLIVETNTKASVSGDEPLLIKLALGDKVVVCVDKNKDRGALFLQEQGVDVIVSDDGMQHYSLDFDVKIVVLDGKRMLGNGFLMPAGPLREGKWKLDLVDAVVVNGETDNHSYYQMSLKADTVVSLNSFFNGVEPKVLEQKKVIALAGIGNPQRFYNTLTTCGFKIVDTIAVPDHGVVDKAQLENSSQEYPIVMTAKDAVKYKDYKLDNLYVLNVKACLKEQFYQKIIDSLSKIKK